MRRLTIIPLLVMALTASAFAVAPHPDAIEKWKSEGIWDEKVAAWQAFKARGGCAPNEVPIWSPRERGARSLAAQDAPDTVHVVVLLVEFSDNRMSGGPVNGTAAVFDSILFSDSTIDTTGAVINPTGSMTDYYMEVTYRGMFLKGDIYGPYTAPEPYSYYVGSDDGLSKSGELVQWLTIAADPEVDFSIYANGDSQVDGLIVIHAGAGAEEGAYGIWSHKSSLNATRDGVQIPYYTMNPEEAGSGLSAIGVFCHEFGHVLGLPDLYDISYTTGSSGAGRWSLMGSGNYNFNSKRPAHLDAWCKADIGLVNVVEVTQNLYQAAIPAVEHNPIVYKLMNSTTGSSEYWLVENRRQAGFDINIPGFGLCIWHYDGGTAAGGGSNLAPPYRIALEQADGQFQLEYSGSSGDGGDPFPGATGNRNFHDFSLPATNLNDITTPLSGGISRIGVWNISNVDSVMYADLDVEFSRPWIVLPYPGNTSIVFNDDPPRGDGDGVLEPGEEIEFYCYIQNRMRYSYNVRASLTSQSEGLQWLTPSVPFNTDLIVDVKHNTDPIVFRVPDSLTAVIDTFTLTIVTDSLPGETLGSEFVKEFKFAQQLGATQVLVVDDDQGANYQQEYVDALLGRGIPSRVWNVQTQGSPDSTDLLGYRIVFWHTGLDTTSGAITAADVAAMKGYLNGADRNLFVGTMALRQLVQLDSGFVEDRFRATYAGQQYWPFIFGVAGTSIGNGTQYGISSLVPPSRPVPYMSTFGGGESIFNDGSTAPTRIRGVSHSGGQYKTVLLTVPPEFINDGAGGANLAKDTLISRVMSYFGGQATAVYDGSPFTMLPQSFTLSQNYPNPFNPSTTIQYTLRSTGTDIRNTPRTKLMVYNALGQQVAKLIDEVQIPGTYQVSWDGADQDGRRVASGVYFYRLERGDEAQTLKMVLLK